MRASVNERIQQLLETDQPVLAGFRAFRGFGPAFGSIFAGALFPLMLIVQRLTGSHYRWGEFLISVAAIQTVSLALSRMMCRYYVVAIVGESVAVLRNGHLCCATPRRLVGRWPIGDARPCFSDGKATRIAVANTTYKVDAGDADRARIAAADITAN